MKKDKQINVTDISIDELVQYAIGTKKLPIVKLSNKLMVFNMNAMDHYNDLLNTKNKYLDTESPIVLLHHNDKFIMIPFDTLNSVPPQLRDFVKYLVPQYNTYKTEKHISGYRISCSTFFKSNNESYELNGELGEISSMVAIIFDMKKIK